MYYVIFKTLSLKTIGGGAVASYRPEVRNIWNYEIFLLDNNPDFQKPPKLLTVFL